MGRDLLCSNISDDLSPLAPYLGPDGITVPDDVTLTSFLDRNAAACQGRPAYRFIDYRRDTDGVAVELSWMGFATAVRAIAARLQQIAEPGDRVAILAPQGLDYVTAFFAAVHAGTISVPLFAPTLAGHAERLGAVLADARPAVILTTSAAAESVRRFTQTLPRAHRPRLIAVDAVPASLATYFREPRRNAADIAYLQYTSGSTRIPAGVEITHRAVCTNVVQMILAGGLDPGIRSVSWLPLYHDMGLVMIMFPMLCGGHITLMDPMAFVRRPYRWIKQLASEARHGRTFAAAPNFAFSLAAERGLPPAGEQIDLSNVVGLLNGSEPVSLAAIEQFNAAFAPYGLQETTIKPSYGMAEATLSVASIAPGERAIALHFDRTQLAAGHAVTVPADHPNAVAYVSCGTPVPDQWVTIVDSERGAEQPDRMVGEIWLHGNNIGRGYWGREEESDRTFGNKLQIRLETGSHAEGVPDNGQWLATGDLGVYVDGRLYITGRIKDLVIVDGVNHYPHDIETTAAQASSAIRSGYVAAFTVPAPESGEQLIVVAERAIRARQTDAVADDVRAAVSRLHRLRITDLRLVPAGAIPRTTSGKIARKACRSAYLAGEFGPVISACT
ncbi:MULTISPECIES: fatty acyl-AMP ligase [Mycobacterium]|uniref:Nitrate ABC transporter substrate-binding protein n=1 Tax=Mycobacterium kiyosense TaxID=2871094 RepID=A0A9P3UUG6_9MYCO|nr:MULTISPECIES: fatty acyl-AMP ligase [Mycobacterium]BDB39671.1 nitrate ABC transporter substrate-binding protein [Mycobacterium kiyosense]BDE11529.1 nitrate ABC transporter substrate-binding protein [Mycobacterium sp. 20KCMC460]GLB82387.1 nitrate ABC transporter substrate-binding protein [Mycobacterium kiyosense]GLB88906.1 nitrate ABC transporter substrate-binding protein [Mycobacterium kiyosense]GLB95602.1 nitrate ABC transporter substrate-binding protein [Mycobacterium kiyosense]